MDAHLNLLSSICDYEASSTAKEQGQEVLRGVDPNEEHKALDDMEASAEAEVYVEKHSDKEAASKEEREETAQRRRCSGDDTKMESERGD